MKKKLQVGSQIDINASFDGGAVDTSVEYSVPADQQDVVTVDASTGVVQAVSVGTATVEVKDTSGNLLRAIVFQVLSAEDFAMQDDLDTGAADFTAEFAEVSPAPVVAKLSPTLTQFYDIGPTGYVFFAGNYGPGFNRGAGVAADGSNNVGRYDYLWDGELNSYWYAQSSQGAVGYLSEFSTTLKEVKFWSNHQNLTARPTQVVVYGSNVEPTSYAGGTGNPPFALGSDTGWTQIASENITWGNSVSELRTIDLSSNAVAYKHYKVALICGEAYVALGGIEFWGLS